MLMRHMILKTATDALDREVPEMYEVQNYIMNTGAISKDLVYKATNNTRILLNVEITYFPATTWRGITGYYSSSTTKNFCIYVGATSTSPTRCITSWFGTQTKASTVGAVVGVPYKLELSQKGFKINDSLEGEFQENTFTAGGNLYIFAAQSGTGNYLQFKIFNYKIWESGILVRDFVPVKQKSTSYYGLFDKIGKTFIPSGSVTGSVT